jgi:DNA-binding response OmpR family regulator
MNIRVLLVDDEVELVNFLAERLTLREFTVSKAYTGDEALQLLDDIRIDVVILDVMLPGIDGLETLREIKKKLPLVEVIMLTGHGTLETAVEGMKLGAYDFLFKPVDTKILVEKIAKAYRRKSEHEDRIRNAEIDQIMGPIGDLAAGIAHEINNPVAIMVEEAGWIDDLLKDGDFSRNENLDELKHSLMKIKTQGERCKEITH